LQAFLLFGLKIPHQTGNGLRADTLWFPPDLSVKRKCVVSNKPKPTLDKSIVFKGVKINRFYFLSKH